MKNLEKIDLVDLRIFRAVDEAEMTLDFSIAFMDHFNASGIAAVSSTEMDWINDPHVYVVGFYKGDKPIGGARLHLANPEYVYPLTTALRTVGVDATSFISDLYFGNHAEACGLWISNRYKGLGIMQFMCGSLLSLGRNLGLDRVYAICPRHTLDSLRRLGYQNRFDGDEVFSFDYPTPDFVSYMIESDVRTMTFAARKEKKMMDAQLEKSSAIHTTRGRMGDLFIQMHGIPSELPLSFVHRESRRRTGVDPVKRKGQRLSTKVGKMMVYRENTVRSQ